MPNDEAERLKVARGLSKRQRQVLSEFAKTSDKEPTPVRLSQVKDRLRLQTIDTTKSHFYTGLGILGLKDLSEKERDAELNRYSEVLDQLLNSKPSKLKPPDLPEPSEEPVATVPEPVPAPRTDEWGSRGTTLEEQREAKVEAVATPVVGPISEPATSPDLSPEPVELSESKPLQTVTFDLDPEAEGEPTLIVLTSKGKKVRLNYKLLKEVRKIEYENGYSQGRKSAYWGRYLFFLGLGIGLIVGSFFMHEAITRAASGEIPLDNALAVLFTVNITGAICALYFLWKLIKS